MTEETLRLRQEVERLQAEKKKVEQDHASVTDEFTRYKDATEARATPVAIQQKPVPDKPGRRALFLRRS